MEEIQAAVDGVISKEQAIKLRQCLEHIDQLEEHKQSIKNEILSITKLYSDTLELLRTIPSFDKNPMTPITVLSEICSDMTVFSTAKHLCSWSGCCPRNDRSNKKVKCRRISQAGTYLKSILVQDCQYLDKIQVSYVICGMLPPSKIPPWTQESHYRNLQNATDRYLEHSKQECAIYK
ncbi:IS110 family transposase [uncultured Anaerovibrio sp.]|uniref:IS110 family transposase n=1 Tax=uncultured Anaerovibrio sp. TaxID=361586 RepID=UPI00261994CA|nr:IS110 family transposase [uncultured Anaerovibrio sp.]